MKKMISLASAAAIALGVCAGCGSGAGNSNGKTKLTVGEWPAEQGAELTNKTNQKLGFEQQNPDITIEGDTWIFDVQTFYPKAVAGTLPNLYKAHYTEADKIMKGGYSKDLTEIAKKKGYFDNINPIILDTISKGGKMYAIPEVAYVLGLACNVEMFEKAGLMNADGTPMQPKTWDEVADFAVKIKAATGKPGMAVPTASNVGGWLFTPIAWSYGVDFMEEQPDGKWKATFDTPEAVAALQYIKDLKWKYDVLPSNTLINYEEYFKTFGTEQVGIVISAGDIPRNIHKYEFDNNKLGMLAIPAGPKRHVTLLGGSMFCIANNASDAQVEAALKWLDFTGKTYLLTDDAKKAKDADLAQQIEEGRHIGIKSMQVWKSDSEVVKYEHKLIDDNANADPNHVKLYNEAVNDPSIEIQPEEPVCAQDLYALLDGCIQEVLTNKDADPAKLIAQANESFQKNYLDKQN